MGWNLNHPSEDPLTVAGRIKMYHLRSIQNVPPLGRCVFSEASGNWQVDLEVLRQGSLSLARGLWLGLCLLGFGNSAGFGVALGAILDAVTATGHGNDLGVMQQAIQDGAGGGYIAQKLAPFFHRAV